MAQSRIIQQPPARVLLVVRDIDYREALIQALGARGYDVESATDRIDCARILATKNPSVLVVDVQATGVFSQVPEGTKIPIITIANRPTEVALRNLSLRSTHVLTKPVEIRDLCTAIDEALKNPTANCKAIGNGSNEEFETRSPVMLALLDNVERLRNADCPVLILGETGTGKTVLARRIHGIGARPGGSFVDLNCAGLSTDFVESELFGHERGSFTGAHAAKPGLLDVAHGGTLFLDEIGDIDIRVQPKILKVLEEKRYRRMGDVRERDVDVRLIAATHHDLLTRVSERAFRADLYYRISTIKIVVPPLRERREDIIPLALSMLERRGASCTLSSSAQERLVEYAWPGNIRELKNVIESAAILRSGQALTADDLRFDIAPPPSEHLAAVTPIAVPTAPATPLLGTTASTTTREDLERAHIQLVLLAENGHVESAARRLGMPRSTLYWKLRRYGLKGPIDRLRAGSE